MSLAGKKIKNTYRDLVHVDNGNGGLPGSVTSRIRTGKGDNMPFSCSSKTFSVTPASNTTDTFNVKNYAGTSLLKCNTTDMQVTAGENNYYVNTAVKEFSLSDFTPTAGYHTPLITNPITLSDSGDDYAVHAGFGANGGDPLTVLDFSSGSTAFSKSMFPGMWYNACNAKVETARFFLFCEAANTFNIHVMKYDISVAGGTIGDLSNGSVIGVAENVVASTTGIISDTITWSSTEIEAEKVVFIFIENVTAATQFSVNLSLKYHLK